MSNNQNNQINLKSISEAVDSILTITEDIKTKLTDNEYKKLLETLKVIHDKNNKKVNWCKYKVKFLITFPKIINQNGDDLIIIDEKEINQCFYQKEIKDEEFERFSSNTFYLRRRAYRIIWGKKYGRRSMKSSCIPLKESISKAMINITTGYPPNVKVSHGKTKMKIDLELKIKVKYIKKLKIYDDNYENPRVINYDSEGMDSDSDSDSSSE